MSSNCIITQVHVPDHDVQGVLTASCKLEIVEFGLRHLRSWNPDAYIIMTGHGHRPKNLDLCDWSYWEDECRPLNEHGYVIGMPAQYYFVHQGIKHAAERGFTRCLKTRGDCVIGIRNVVAHCDAILNDEDKPLLITQQTGNERMGDCFMFGDVNVLHGIWHEDNAVFSPDGLQNTARHFRSYFNDFGNWESLIKKRCAFRDVDELKFTCLRWNYRYLAARKILPDAPKPFAGLLEDDFQFENWHWGRTNGWCRFDEDRNITAEPGFDWSRKRHYS